MTTRTEVVGEGKSVEDVPVGFKLKEGNFGIIATTTSSIDGLVTIRCYIGGNWADQGTQEDPTYMLGYPDLQRAKAIASLF